MLIEILIGILVGIVLVFFPLLIGIVAFFLLVRNLRECFKTPQSLLPARVKGALQRRVGTLENVPYALLKHFLRTVPPRKDKENDSS